MPSSAYRLGPTLAGFREALSRERVDCVFLTSPNYFGIVGEIGPIIALAHERGLPVVVDAAHAPHFHFCEAMPKGAEDLGADLVTQSTHKVASALAQGSLLLVGNESFIEPLYEHVNELGLVSTSFSYPILASVELGIRQLVEEGEAIWSTALTRARGVSECVSQLAGCHMLRSRTRGQAWISGHGCDPRHARCVENGSHRIRIRTSAQSRAHLSRRWPPSSTCSSS